MYLCTSSDPTLQKWNALDLDLPDSPDGQLTIRHLSSVVATLAGTWLGNLFSGGTRGMVVVTSLTAPWHVVNASSHLIADYLQDGALNDDLLSGEDTNTFCTAFSTAWQQDKKRSPDESAQSFQFQGGWAQRTAFSVSADVAARLRAAINSRTEESGDDGYSDTVVQLKRTLQDLSKQKRKGGGDNTVQVGRKTITVSRISNMSPAAMLGRE